jgi:hypothetical protein
VKFNFDVDPDPPFKFDVYPEPAFHSKEDPDPVPEIIRIRISSVNLTVTGTFLGKFLGKFLFSYPHWLLGYVPILGT